MIHLYMYFYSAIKRNELSMQQPGWISRELCWVEKKNNHKRLHTLWLHIYCILEMTNYRSGGQISGCQGLRRGWGQRGSECGNKGVEMVCVTADVLAVILLYYSFTRYHHWWKWNHRYKGSLYCFLQGHVNIWLSPNKKCKKHADCRASDLVSPG